MKIEVAEKGSEAFYREVVNISAQYRYILKNPHRKLKDYFRQFTFLMILGTVFLVLLLLTSFLWGFDPLDYAIIGILAIAIAMCAVYLHLLKRTLRTFLSDPRTTVLSFDESGVEFNKGSSQTIKLGWDNIAVVRVYQESLNFVSGDHTGIVISCAKRYAGEILAWLRANQPTVEIVEN